MEKKYLLISMEDEKAKHLSDVLGNKTSKKVIDVLAEANDLSEKDIADKLNLPINTVEYNLQKLLKAELVEKTRTFFWSSKGKKIPTYRLSNKSIIISPKSSRVSSKIKSILPVALLSGIGAVILRQYIAAQSVVEPVLMKSELAMSAQNTIVEETPNLIQIAALGTVWLWFLAGAVLTIVLFTLLNWRKL